MGLFPLPIRLLLVGLALTGGARAGTADTTAGADAAAQAVLLDAYFKYGLAEQVAAQAAALKTRAQPDDAAQIEAVMAQAHRDAMADLRDTLQARLGANAKERFEAFIAAYTEAEQAGDKTFLADVSAAAQSGPVSDYATLRRHVMEQRLAREFQAAIETLSLLEEWTEARRTRSGTPSYAAWRAQRSPPKATATSTPRAPMPNALAEAEAPVAGGVDDRDVGAVSALDAFSATRKDRRDQALKEAQAGMQQVAAERQAAEQEYAAKKAAAAQADAQAATALAQKMAAVDQEALDQRKNSWASKLKEIVGATVSSATGTFTGEVGARAGRAAVHAVFDD